MVEVDEGADSKKNVISGRNTCSNNCETSMNVQLCLRPCRMCSKKRLQQALRGVEQRRNDLLLEHQKKDAVTKSCRAYRTGKKQCRKDLGKGAGDSEWVRDDKDEKACPTRGQNIQKSEICKREMKGEAAVLVKRMLFQSSREAGALHLEW